MSAPASRAIFLSYAREDAASAQRIADALRAFGMEVWFDRNELRGGDAWDAKIRQEIHACALFLPIVSAHTEARGEGYFRREWHLAADRTHDIARGVPFIVPVVIDGTPEAGATVPAEFLAVQWSYLPGAVPATHFVERMQQLLTAPRTPAPVVRAAPTPVSVDAPWRESLRWVATIGSAAALAFVAYFVFRPAARPSAVLPTTTNETKPPATVAANDRSIAVLPFDKIGAEKDTASFVDGFHDELISRLALIGELRVISRQTVVEYPRKGKPMRQLGQEMGVAYVLEGSVQSDGRRVKVIAQLIRAATDEHVWTAKPYHRDISDIFALQSDLAQDIATSLHAALSPREKVLLEQRPTENATAYDLFLQARELRNRSGVSGAALQRQEELLQGAVDADPKFASAWAELAFVRGRLYNTFIRQPERAQKAKVALDRAVELAPNAPETIRALGDYAGNVLGDYGAAVVRFEQFVQLQPNNASARWSLGVAQRHRGDWIAALANLRRATELEPASVAYARDLADLLRAGRRYEEAMVEQRRLVGIRPASIDYPRTLAMLAFEAHGSTHEMDEFVAGLVPNDEDPIFRTADVRKTWARTRGDFGESIRLDRAYAQYRGTSGSPWLFNEGLAVAEAAMTLAAAGERAEACERLGKLPEKCRAQLELTPDNPGLWAVLGLLEAVRGNKDEARRCARRAAELNPESQSHWSGPAASLAEAWVLAWTGDNDGAFAKLERLFRTPSVWEWSVHHAKHGPWLAPLRGDPRLDALLNDPKNNAPLF